MCTRYALRSPLELLQRLFGFGDDVELAARYNIAPAQDVLAVYQDESGTRHAGFMRWGLGFDSPGLAPIVNVRAETADQRPTFRDAARHRRALVLTDGFYEWREVGSIKQPYLFERPDRAPFGMAALYEVRGGKRECALLTMEPVPVVAAIHDRMTVVLPAEDAGAWLAGNAPTPDIIPLGARAELTCRPLDRAVNDVRREGPELIRPPRQRSLF